MSKGPFNFLPSPETHQERAELLRSLVRCDECASMGRPGHLGSGDVYLMDINTGMRDPLVCQECHTRCVEGKMEASLEAMRGPVSVDEVLDHCGILLCQRTGRVYLPNALVFKWAHIANSDPTQWERGEHLEFTDALIIIQGCELNRRLGRLPFEGSLAAAKKRFEAAPRMDQIAHRAGENIYGRGAAFPIQPKMF